MRRFWREVAVIAPEAPGEGHGIALDGRPLNTPAKRAMRVPAASLAEAVAEEWRAVRETVDPLAMPLTRAANVTLDRVIEDRPAIARMVAAYGETDLVCYRAPHPPALVERQAALWDPLVAWAETRYGARLVLAEGVMHVAQPEASVAALRRAVESYDPWRLTPLHELVVLSGSLVIALAVAEGELAPEEGWHLSRLDEDWQTEQWGEDAEAAAAATRKAEDFAAAARLLRLLGG